MRRTPLRLTFSTTALLLATLAGGCAHNNVTGPRVDLRAEPFLDTVQTRTFNFFWERTNAANGLTPDRWPSPSFSSIAAVGFALSAYPVGVEHGYVTRQQAAERTLTTLRWFYQAPQGAASSGVSGNWGFFYHFLDMNTGARFQTVELSTIDTALLLGGALFCREYFDQANPTEESIRAYADSLYTRVDWTQATTPQTAPKISMGWSPEHGWLTVSYGGYDEAMLLYLLALGSPTHPVDAAAWSAFTSTNPWLTFQGQTHVNFAPLFGHQYSQMYVDFRGIQDAYMRAHGIDYFENSRRATLAQRSYASANPAQFRDYSADVWGLTASDGPADTTLTLGGRSRQFRTYWARGAAANEIADDGTLAPTAAGGSVPFAPEIAIPALKTMRAKYGDALFSQYGFLDAFNPTFTDAGAARYGHVVGTLGWFDTDYLGIDQGPILGMIENYRSELIWKYMRKSPYIRKGLERAGFTGGWLGT
ncbi:MAG TPA: glucoamylase family protein [Gemmatimonadaceae bacterium]